MIRRFGISTVLLLMLSAGIGLGWLVDRERLSRQIEQENRPIGRYGEKFAYWSPSLYLGVDNTLRFESALVDKVTFRGDTRASSQGMSESMLRRPDAATLESTLFLLNDHDAETRLAAARLLALYLEASSGSSNLDVESLAIRVQFHALGLRRVLDLLDSPAPNMRSASALILGNSLYDSHTIDRLSETFDEESDDNVKLHLAWAYWRLGHNYPRAAGTLDRNVPD